MRGLESGRRGVGLLAVALAIVACGSSSGSGATHAAVTPASMHRVSPATKHASLDGPTFNHPETAPVFALRNYTGGLVKLAAYRGRAVLLTFVYTHCRDVCPTIVAGLQNALGLLGPRASEVQVIGVSVDPRGDTRGAVAAFLARHHMSGHMKYLVGTQATLRPVWRRWGVSASNPAAGDTVSHTSVVFGIGANGKVMTAYPANFSPSEIAHDVPLLAAL